MQSIQIDGTFTFANNIKKLKIGERVKLAVNPQNRINSEAVGVYTMEGNKIGYVPFKVNQIDIKAKYIVTKINLTQGNSILLISREFEESNFIQSEPEFIKELKYTNNNSVELDKNFKDDLKHFYNYLVKAGNQVTNLKITYIDHNYVNLYIETAQEEATYMTVTKKYYEDNIFKYDEFYKFKLIPKCIYQQFQIHRLEEYLERSYKSINKLLKMNKLKFNALIKTDIFDLFDKINDENFGFETIKVAELKTIKNTDISYQNYSESQIDNLIKLIIQYTISSNQYYDPSIYLKYINPQINFNFKPTIDEFTSMFNDVKLGGLCYNHNLKYYCSIDLYDCVNIIDISTEKTISKNKFIELVLKLVISNKSIVNLYNPLEGTIYRLEIPELIINKISNIIMNR
jgi:hypothetical protein